MNSKENKVEFCLTFQNEGTIYQIEERHLPDVFENMIIHGTMCLKRAETKYRRPGYEIVNFEKIELISSIARIN